MLLIAIVRALIVCAKMAAPDFNEYIAQGMGRKRHRPQANVQPEGSTSRPLSSHLGQMLLQSWAWGDIGAGTLQKLAHAAVLDGSQHTDLVKLASLGSTGLYPGNCHRDLLQFIGTLVALPRSVHVPVPLALDADEPQLLQLPLLPVHRVIAHLHKHCPKQFRRMFVGEPGDIERFWASVRADDPRLQACRGKLAEKPGFDQCLVPLALHGDAVPVFRGKSKYIVSATSLLGKGWSLDQKFLITGYWAHLLAKNSGNKDMDTEHQVWRFIQWDLNALWSGLHPATDMHGNQWPQGSQDAAHAGQPLADGYCALVWILKGDLEYFANVLGLEHWSSNSPCMACKVDRAANPWTDHRLLGLLRLQWTPRDWLECHRHKHALWTWGHLGVWSLAFDVMHIISLGVAQHIAGNVLFELVWYCLAKVGTLKQRLRDVWYGITEYYRSHAGCTEVSKLTLSMFTDPARPHQAYPLCTTKAKETEYLCRALATIWPQYMDEDMEAHMHINRTLQLLLEVYDLAGSPGLFMTLVQQQRIVSTVNELHAHYNWLAKQAEDSGHKRWNTVLKFHYLGHLALQCKYLHCRAGATYLDEDFMGRMKAVTRKSSGGGLWKTTDALLAKYIRGVFLRWRATEDNPLL